MPPKVYSAQPPTNHTLRAIFERALYRVLRVRLSSVHWVVVTILLFSFSGFSFFDLFGVRRPVQIAALVFCGLTVVMLLLVTDRVRLPRRCASLFLSYWLVVVLMSLLLRLSFLEAANGLIAILIFVSLVLAGPESSRRFGKVAVLVASMFALMGIIQFLILLVRPDLMTYTNIPNNYTYLSSDVVIRHPIGLLGLTTGPEDNHTLFGIPISRARSFMFEPSLANAYFLLPAGLALLTGRRGVPLAILLIVFSLLTFSGTVLLAIGLGAAAVVVSRRGTVSRLALTIAPFFFIATIIAFTTPGYRDTIVSIINIPGQLVEPLIGTSVFQKTTSAMVRLSMYQNAIDMIAAYPLGMSEPNHSSIGTFFLSYLDSGPVGFACNIAVMSALFWHVGTLVGTRNAGRLSLPQTVGAALIYGALFVSFAFTSYGFTSAYGMVLLYLTKELLENADASLAAP